MIVRFREPTSSDFDLEYQVCVLYHKLLLYTVLISSVLRPVFVLWSCTQTQVCVKCQKTAWYTFGRFDPKIGKDDCYKAPPLAAVEPLFG